MMLNENRFCGDLTAILTDLAEVGIFTIYSGNDIGTPCCETLNASSLFRDHLGTYAAHIFDAITSKNTYGHNDKASKHVNFNAPQ